MATALNPLHQPFSIFFCSYGLWLLPLTKASKQGGILDIAVVREFMITDRPGPVQGEILDASVTKNATKDVERHAVIAFVVDGSLGNRLTVTAYEISIFPMGQFAGCFLGHSMFSFVKVSMRRGLPRSIHECSTTTEVQFLRLSTKEPCLHT